MGNEHNGSPYNCSYFVENRWRIEIIDCILLLDTLCWTFSVVLGPLIFTKNIHNILIQMFHEIFDTLFPLIIQHKIEMSDVKSSNVKLPSIRYKYSSSSSNLYSYS